MPLSRFSCLLLALAVPLFAACSYGDHPHHDHWSDNGNGSQTPSTVIEEATIDADQTLDVDPGVGAGAFIEYDAGGTYHVTTSCDVSGGSDCYWDIIVTPLDGASVGAVSTVDLETDDSVSVGNGQAHFVGYTGKDFDGFSLQTDPGAALEVDALLDNGAANRYLFWVGDGALHSGAPSNPIDLVPSAN